MQGEIEAAFSTFFREQVSVLGCGRTDTGVHATNYVLHFDLINEISDFRTKGLNALLPDDISINSLTPVDVGFHARFSCRYRAYSYYLHQSKDPFRDDRSYRFYALKDVDWSVVNKAAALIEKGTSFYPFCKSNSGVEHYRCQIFKMNWSVDLEQDKVVFQVAANRFLRGMVRLLVGAQLNCGLGKLSLQDIGTALDEQSRLHLDWSVPAHGLFLDELRYVDQAISG